VSCNFTLATGIELFANYTAELDLGKRNNTNNSETLAYFKLPVHVVSAAYPCRVAFYVNSAVTAYWTLVRKRKVNIYDSIRRRAILMLKRLFLASFKPVLTSVYKQLRQNMRANIPLSLPDKLLSYQCQYCKVVIPYLSGKCITTFRSTKFFMNNR